MVTRKLIAIAFAASGLTFGVSSLAQQGGVKPKASASAPAIDTSLEPLPPPPIAPKPKASVSAAPPPKPLPPPVPSTPPAPLPPPVPTTTASAAPATTVAAPILAIASVHHAPIAVAKPHETLDVEIELVNPHLAKRVLLIYHHGAANEELAFLRSGEGYVARIPAEHVNPPGLSYAIEVEGVDGKRTSAFATRESLHPIQIPDDLDDERERLLLARLDNRRSYTSATADYVYYGKSLGDRDATGRDPIPVRDEYFRAEASYIYRPLRTIFEFGIRIGAVRGYSPTGAFDGSKVGLNYGSPTATFRAHDIFHIQGWLVTSVTEQGFSTGAGLALHIGDPLGSKLVLAGETVRTFGNRGWARLDIMRGMFRLSPVVEVGDIPHARLGVRLYTELAFRLGQGFDLAIRGGYQARDFNSGGPSGGLTIGYAF
jgi:hypothetical protein